MDTPIQNLESEIELFASSLPYWAQYLAAKLLAGMQVSDLDIDKAYNYLLEDLDLSLKSARTEIKFAVSNYTKDNFKKNIYLSNLSKVEGVNALSEGQTIEFCPNLTIVFGTNGAGKSGYVRLLKKAFYSKAPEEIQPNVYLTSTPKKISAEFSFISDSTVNTISYPFNSSNPEFKQFSVFDGKSVVKHLEAKNQFEFGPAGLSFFGNITELIRKMENKLSADVIQRQSINNFSELFDGLSEIKTLLSNLSGKTDIKVLKKFTPFTEADKKEKEEKQKKYDEIILALRNKEKETSTLSNLSQLIANSKQSILNLNRFFDDQHLSATKAAIENCLEKEEIAKKEGVQSFSNEYIKGIGSVEWKNFIIAAEKFAKQQSDFYPNENDSCILCHQPLSNDAQKLISNYWIFIRSLAEKDAKDANQTIENGIKAFEKLNFDLFPEDNILSNWLNDGFADNLNKIKEDLTKQKQLCSDVIEILKRKERIAGIPAFQISISDFEVFEMKIKEKLDLLVDSKANAENEKLSSELLLLVHKEKLNLHFSKIEKFIDDQKWILKAGKVSWGKRGVTEAEKSLSNKYFNQKYVDAFNEECKNLDGTFGISITHTGSGGTSYRQLFIQGHNPTTILSEGEQKVIAISDFLAEMKLSDINKGIIFDDPVNSLDHARKEIIAKRLVDEAKIKQVIVFTHDIFFLLSLQYYSSNAGGIDKAISLYKTNSLIGITKSSLPWIASNVTSRCGQLKDDLVRITKLSKTVDPDVYRIEVKTWCGMLREAWERTVEERLFKGVVTRFTFGIETQKLKYVVVTKELIDEINDGMTKTSKWVHDQASGQNSPTPKPEDLQTMINDFENFIKNKCKVQ